MSVLQKLSEIDRRYLYWVMFIALAIPFIQPVGLPISVTETTRALYDKIETMGPNDVALYSIAGGVSAWGEIQPAMIAVMKHLVAKRVKVVIVGYFLDQDLSVQMVQKSTPGLKDYKYGTDWVYLGYISGAETAVAQLAADIHAVFKTDKGTVVGEAADRAITELPLMQKVRKAEDINLVVTIDTGSYILYYVRHWNVAKGIPVAEVGIAMQADMIVYYPVNLVAVLIGARGGAEYEVLIKQPGTGIVKMDAINVSHVLFIIAIAFANVGYVLSRKGGRK